MQFRTLGRSGTAVSTLALGTMDFGSITDEQDAHAVLDAFADAGGNLLDTSNVYNRGLSEHILGRWLASRPADVVDRVVLTTKGRHSRDADVNAAGTSRRALRRALDGSLQRLGRDHVDLYQMHAWDPITPVEETIAFLDDAVRSGKVDHVGVSNFLGWQLQLFVSTARAMGAPLPVTIQSQYSLLSREIEYEVVPAALHNEIGILPWSPLAGGFLADKYQRGVQPDPATRAGGTNPLYQWVSGDYASHDQSWDTIEAVASTARALGTTPTAVALRWLADQPAVVAPIVGARSVEQLRENLAMVDLDLPAEVHGALDAVSTPHPVSSYPYGAFGVGQRHRSLDGSNLQTDLVGDGSNAPTGKS